MVEKCDGVHGLKHHFDVMGTNDAAVAATANTHRGKLKKNLTACRFDIRD